MESNENFINKNWISDIQFFTINFNAIIKIDSEDSVFFYAVIYPQ